MEVEEIKNILTDVRHCINILIRDISWKGQNASSLKRLKIGSIESQLEAVIQMLYKIETYQLPRYRDYILDGASLKGRANRYREADAEFKIIELDITISLESARLMQSNLKRMAIEVENL